MCAVTITVFITLLVMHFSESLPPDVLRFRSIDFSEMDDSNLFKPDNQFSLSASNQLPNLNQVDEQKKSMENSNRCDTIGNENEKTDDWSLDKLIKLHEVYQEVYILSGHINFPNIERAFETISQKLNEKYKIHESFSKCFKAYRHSLEIMKYDSARRSPEDVAEVEKMRGIYRRTRKIREDRQSQKMGCNNKRKTTDYIPIAANSAKKMNVDKMWSLSDILALHTVHQNVLISCHGCSQFPNQEDAFLEISRILENEYGIRKTHRECLNMYSAQLRIKKIFYSGNKKDDEEKIKQIREVSRKTREIRDQRLKELKVHM